MGVFAVGIENWLAVPMDRLQHAHASKQWAACSAASVRQWAAACTSFMS
jgi:hypothetical protein